MTRVWDRFLTERDVRVYEKAGYGQEAGFKDRPVLLVIDINYGFVGYKREDILTSIEHTRNSCGHAGWDAMENLVPVLEAARGSGVPVIYTTSDPRYETITELSWGAKNSRVNEAPPSTVPVERNQIPEMIAPRAGETVIYKKKPSAFFGTPLIQVLVALGANQLVCCGASTSGCVRATVIDAFSHNFRVAVIEECTFDRGEASHAINLFDMHQKYADVVPARRVIDYFARVDAWKARPAEVSTSR